MPKKINQPRKTIIHIAKEILEKEGYEALNIRYLAQKSGVSIGTIYNYFEDKKGLDQVLMIEFWSGYEQRVESICKDDTLAFYTKLREIYEEMDRFILLFKQLFSQLMENRNYTYSQEERAVKYEMLDRIALSLEVCLLKENPKLAGGEINTKDIAKFILNSFMMASHNRSMTYNDLEPFVRKIIC